MNEGMLWLDDNKNRTIEDKVSRAAEWYREHYDPKPTVCFVNQEALKEEFILGEISIRPATFVRPNHFWIGSGTLQ